MLSPRRSSGTFRLRPPRRLLGPALAFPLLAEHLDKFPVEVERLPVPATGPEPAAAPDAVAGPPSSTLAPSSLPSAEGVTMSTVRRSGFFLDEEVATQGDHTDDRGDDKDLRRGVT